MAAENDGSWILNRECVDCGSSNGLGIFHDENLDTYTGYCYTGCDTLDGKPFKSHNQLCNMPIKDELGITPIRSKRVSIKPNKERIVVDKKKRVKMVKLPVTKEQIQALKDETSFEGDNFRGISNTYTKMMGILTKYSETDGETVTHRYYPVRQKDKEGNAAVVGFSCREVASKDFSGLIGINSKECMFFGQELCKGSGKYLLFTGGQEDAAAAKQMTMNALKGKHNSAPIDIISGTVGEGSNAKQAAHWYDWLNGYDNIIIDMDDDEAGKNAEAKLIDVLPAGKVKIIGKYAAKDANQALEDGIQDDYIRAIYNANRPEIAGIASANDIIDAMYATVSLELIPLPPELKPLSDKLAGGFPRAEIINILAASGIGKTTVLNLLTNYWVFNSPTKMLILSCEASSGQFGIRMFSAYMGHNIFRLESPAEKKRYLDDNSEALHNYMKDEQGNSRFDLVDDRGDLDTLPKLKNIIERSIKIKGTGIILIDPLQDLLSSLPLEEQEEFMSWQKRMKSRYSVNFININHTNKSGGGNKAGSQGGDLVEENMQGTSAIYKSGAVNIILTRNKESDDTEEKNTTSVKVTKSRDAGDTGKAGELFYEVNTATLYNKAEYFSNKRKF